MKRGADTADRVEAAKRCEELARQVASLQEQLRAARAARFVLPAGGRKGRRPNSWCRVVIPDSHGVFLDQGAAASFLSDLEAIRPAEVVWLGDHIDCSGFLAQHHVMGTVAETEYSFEDDVAAANAFIDEVQRRTPKADHHYLFGNHEDRIERWIVTQVQRHRKDAEFLRRLFSVQHVLHLESRKIRHYPIDTFVDGMPLPGVIRLGKCYFTHGQKTAKHAASAMLDMLGSNVVYGHTHRADSYIKRTVHEGAIGAWNPGCLCRLQRTWNGRDLTNWTHGYALQCVEADGSFLHVNVPIVDGQSRLTALTARIA